MLDSTIVDISRRIGELESKLDWLEERMNDLMSTVDYLDHHVNNIEPDEYGEPYDIPDGRIPD